MEDERLPGAQPPEGGDTAPPDDSRWEEGDSLNFLSAPPAGRLAGENSRPVPRPGRSPLKKALPAARPIPSLGRKLPGKSPPAPSRPTGSSGWPRCAGGGMPGGMGGGMPGGGPMG